MTRLQIASWEAGCSLAIALLLCSLPAVQPIHPVRLAMPGIFGAIGLALAIAAIRFGSALTRIVGMIAAMLNGVGCVAIAYDLVAYYW